MALFKKISLSKIDPTQVKDNTAGFLSEAGQRLGSSILKQAKEKFEQEQQAKRLAMQKQIAAMHEAGANARNAATLANNLAIHGTYGQRAADAKAASDTAFAHQKELNGTFDEKMAFKEKELATRTSLAQQKLLAAKARADAAEAKKAQEELVNLGRAKEALNAQTDVYGVSLGLQNAKTPEQKQAILNSIPSLVDTYKDPTVKNLMLSSLQKAANANRDNTAKVKVAESQAKENIAKLEQDAKANKDKNAIDFAFKVANIATNKDGELDPSKAEKIVNTVNKIANGRSF